MSARGIEEVWTGVLAGDAIPVEMRDQLEQAISTDPHLLAELAGDADMHGSLDALEWSVATSDAFVREVRRHLEAEASGPAFVARAHAALAPAPSRRWRRALVFALLAGGLAFAAWRAMSRQPSRGDLTTSSTAEEPGTHAPLPHFVTAQGDEQQPPPSLANGQSSPYEALRQLPVDELESLRAWPASGSGMFTDNKAAWRCSGLQIPGLDTLAVGTVLDRRSWIDEGWRVVDATFARQGPNGAFSDGPNCVGFWLSRLGFALAIVDASPRASQDGSRATALDPSLRRAADYLASRDALKYARSAGIELVAATALASMGARLQQGDHGRAARTLLDHMFAEGRPDAPEDSSAKIANRIRMCTTLLAAFDDERVGALLTRDVERLVSRVSATGDVSNADHLPPACKDEKSACGPMPFWVRDVRWALIAVASRDDRARVAARLVFEQAQARGIQ